MKFILKFSIAFILIITSWNLSSAQKEINNWCFGNNIGMDFNSGSPVIFPGVAISAGTQEGCSSISDSLGHLLFYTDGSKVYNRSHSVMPNGNGLLGSYTTSQGALIVSKPGSTSIYYVFTLDLQNGPQGLNYSVVDMSAAGGMGDVIQLNNHLGSATTFSEKMIGIRHSNGTDYWLIAHKSNSDEFNSFQVSSTGVNPVPVSSHTGVVFSFNDAVGTMHCSLDGSKIATACWDGASRFEVFDFNTGTGVLSNPLVLYDSRFYNAYSVCFSPSGQYLYGGCYNDSSLYQFDLHSGSPAGTLIAKTSSNMGDMQIGPDKKIYGTLYQKNYLCAIVNPDNAGAGCNFIDNYFNSGGTGQIGITNFIYPVMQPSILPVAVFSSQDSAFCSGSCINFTNHSINATSYQWYFAGGSPSSSSVANPTGICYFNSGTFDVTLVATNSTGSDTVTIPNFINIYPPVPFSPLIQNGDTLFSVTGYSSYQWYFDTTLIVGATNSYFIAPQSGDYSVLITDSNGCTALAKKLGVIASVQNLNIDKNDFTSYYSSGILELNINSKTNHSTTVDITDDIGKIIFRKKRNLINGENKISIQVEGISKGIYFIKIFNENRIISHKIFIE